MLWEDEKMEGHVIRFLWRSQENARFFGKKLGRILKKLRKILRNLVRLAVMRRVRAAVIHISRWPSQGTASIAPPSPHPALLFLLPPPREKTDHFAAALQHQMAPRQPKFGQNLGKFAKIRRNLVESDNIFLQNLTKFGHISQNLTT